MKSMVLVKVALALVYCATATQVAARPRFMLKKKPAPKKKFNLSYSAKKKEAEALARKLSRPGIKIKLPKHKKISRRFRAVLQHKATFKPIALSFINRPDVDLRPRIKALDLKIRNQGGRGTCSVHAMTFLLEYMYAIRKGLNYKDLSEEYLNYVCDASKTPPRFRDGDFFSNLDYGYQQWGSYIEFLCPYKPVYDPTYRVPEACMYLGRTWEKFDGLFLKPWDVTTGLSSLELARLCYCIYKNIPVAAGLRWPRDGHFKTKMTLGVDLMQVPTSANVVDGHSIVFVGYKKSKHFPGGGYLVFRNSWGKGFGDQGYGFMPFEYAKRYANDLFIYWERKIPMSH